MHHHIDELTQDIAYSLTCPEDYLMQGESAWLSHNLSSLATIKLTTCIGVVFCGQEAEREKIFLMHLDSLKTLMAPLKAAYSQFRNPPQVVFIANRHDCTLSINELGITQPTDFTYSSVNPKDASKVEKVLNSHDLINLELLAKLYDCKPNELEQVLSTIKIKSWTTIAEILEQNAKMRCIANTLDCRNAIILSSPNVIVTADVIYTDQSDLLSQYLNDTTTSESELEDMDMQASPNWTPNPSYGSIHDMVTENASRDSFSPVNNKL